MTKTAFFLIINFCLLSSFQELSDEISAEDRLFAMNYLEQTKEEVLATVKSLSAQQLNYKANDSTWSIAECIEHIALSEKFIFGLAQGSLQQSTEKGALTMTDEQLIAIITDRSSKAKALEPLQPKNTFDDTSKALEEFVSLRDEHIEYMETTKDGLRSHYFDFPFGKADTYQVILFMGAHSFRHCLQIKELINQQDFPDS